MKKLLIIGLVCMVCSVTANADLLAEYTFGSGAGADLADGVSAGDFLVGAGLSGLAGRSSSGNMYARASATAAENTIDIGNAIRDDDYLSVTITPDTVMSLESLTFDYGYTRVGKYDGKQFKVYLLTNIDGFVDAGDIVGSKVIDVGPNTSTPVYTAASIDLSGAQFQGITTATEFRFYLSDTTGGGDYIHRIDNVQLNGVPEPATLCLLGLGSLVALKRKK